MSRKALARRLILRDPTSPELPNLNCWIHWILISFYKLIFAASWGKKSHRHTDCASLKTRHKHVWPDAYAVIPAAAATRTQQQFCGLWAQTCLFMPHSCRYVWILVMSGEGAYVPVREYLCSVILQRGPEPVNFSSVCAGHASGN